MVLLISSILTFVDIQLLDCGPMAIFGHKGVQSFSEITVYTNSSYWPLDLDLLQKWNDQHAQYVIWQSSCFKRGSMFSIGICGEKVEFFLYTGSILLHDKIFYLWPHKSDFIMAVVKSDVALGPFVSLSNVKISTTLFQHNIFMLYDICLCGYI